MKLTMKQKIWFNKVSAVFWLCLGLVSFLFGWQDAVVLIWIASVYANVKSDWGVAEAADDTKIMSALDTITKEIKLLRQEVLDTAAKYVSSDRNTEYGEPEDNFRTIAEMWNAYLAARPGHDTPEITSADVAAMQALLKVARLAQSPSKADHWIDVAGYAACGAEAAKAGETVATATLHDRIDEMRKEVRKAFEPKYTTTNAHPVESTDLVPGYVDDLIEAVVNRTPVDFKGKPVPRIVQAQLGMV